ncbi:YxlC family protein [Paenibacillus sp. Soil522]|uniref:YxlC family protein n=1 Tax=Paenibacillus sp. Soil522 TaxID=1736388 RepID=UPI0006F2D2A0|nr:YxlC family protein [Paenibacillus sp. Soil522]KRE32697.1 hypothetical protein ASG81_24545 [Paenibacillus sp. Soil522]
MKKPKEDYNDQQWFDEQLGEAVTRFDAAHAPHVPELQQFEGFVQAHKHETKKKLWKELMLFWLTACFIFGSMLWIIDRNWIWFAILQAVIAAGGVGFVSLTFGRRRVRSWRS